MQKRGIKGGRTEIEVIAFASASLFFKNFQIYQALDADTASEGDANHHGKCQWQHAACGAIEQSDRAAVRKLRVPDEEQTTSLSGAGGSATA